ncbi:MAG TPA: SNF2-related protein, partial [Anaerolineales bacterium]|nr:SNF2-related protein [Anaerolineales bacterium]
YYHQIAARLPVHGEMVEVQDVTAEAIPRLYLRAERGTLMAEVRFGYGEHELQADPDPVHQSTMDLPGSWTLLHIHRQPEREAQFYELLTDARFGLKRAGREFPYGTFEIRARLHPYDFLMHCIPALTQAGFEIFGDTSALGKINHNTPVLRVSVNSGLDWFELNATVQYGDQEIALAEVRKALRKGEHYIKLADGSIGQIPEAWLERYKHLFALGEETGSGLRLNNLQLSLVDELLADADKTEIAPEFYQQRDRLKTLDGIQPQPAPRGFTGQLRPYQQAGLDWLHFLRDYRFGGILADDMGLGKTIQVLAFLQSLKEAGAGGTTLLVVPKSLLANWQRESARFTPDLQILEYYGTSRNKGAVDFGAFDIVLTTYGTLLRDIEHLRAYCFQYAILDESQAIKNPMAQSARAVRLIQAEHRLAMTGTPVENNTFELWSQFAFVNPGLLGSMEYFKREFAAPIENRQSEETAALLKRMIHPFLLRRTKEQVAPELPPRTERIVFTDLEPSQRKLYQQTRDYYRGLLLGIIDEDGMENARMKILEGLLRLRQICIHPALVEPTYKGNSAKFEVLLETMDTLQAEGHKALVFSQFVQTLHLLEKEMRGLGLSYAYLDGRTHNRQERVDQFQGDPSLSFFLISLKAGGVGLNLTAADYVLHIDPWWNPAVEMQAADRAHRIGQEKPVFIYKFITRDTVEEKILELQSRKKKLVEQLIAAEGSFFKSISKEDVQALFS